MELPTRLQVKVKLATVVEGDSNSPVKVGYSSLTINHYTSRGAHISFLVNKTSVSILFFKTIRILEKNEHYKAIVNIASVSILIEQTSYSL